MASLAYEDLVKIIDDPNINKAMAMPAEQLKQIKSQQRKTHAGSKDNSGEEVKISRMSVHRILNA